MNAESASPEGCAQGADAARLRVAVVDYSTGGPRRLCTFTWTKAEGVTCDSAAMLVQLEEEGIALPPGKRLIYPVDGRAFLEALPLHFSGLVRAQVQ